MATRLDLDRLETDLVALAEHDRVAAEASYASTYFPAVLAHVGTHEARRADLLVLTVGAQPQSVAVSLVGTPARHVYFLHTAEHEGNVAKALALAGIADGTYRAHRVEVGRSDALGIYRVVQRILENTPGNDVVLDMTSGTKVMTSALAAAAGYVRLREGTLTLRYVESEPRQRMFFHRSLLDFDHPAAVLGERERHEANEAYRRGDYGPAAALFEGLDARRIPGYTWAARAHLSRMYDALGRLAFDEARAHLAQARSVLRSVAAPLAPEPGLRGHDLAPLGGLFDALVAASQAAGNGTVSPAAAPEQAWALLRYLLARARHTLARDPALAALLYYRALELAAQRRLATHGLNASAFAPPDPGALLERYNALAQKGQRLEAFPPKVALVQVLIVLRALDDPCVSEKTAQAIEHAGQARNNSLYAHGFEKQSALVNRLATLAQAFVAEVAGADSLPLPAQDHDPDFDPVVLS